MIPRGAHKSGEKVSNWGSRAHRGVVPSTEIFLGAPLIQLFIWNECLPGTRHSVLTGTKTDHVSAHRAYSNGWLITIILLTMIFKDLRGRVECYQDICPSVPPFTQQRLNTHVPGSTLAAGRTHWMKTQAKCGDQPHVACKWIYRNSWGRPERVCREQRKRWKEPQNVEPINVVI